MALHETSDKTGLPSGLAVDFGGTKIAAARLLNGIIVQQIETRTNGGADTNAQIGAITDLIDRLGVNQADRIGVAVTGRVTSAGVWHALNTKTLAKLDAIPLKQMLSEKYQRVVNVQNDATAAVIGEHLAGGGRGFHSLGFITVSTGVGGGIILNDVPLQSKNGLANHVGFTTSRVARDKCGSGRWQTVESIASGKAIARMAQELGHPVSDAKAVYTAHLDGQVWASDLIQQSAQAIAELCTNLQALLELEVVLLGGSIGLAEGYLSLVGGFILTEPEIFRPRISHATLGVNGTLIGVLAS